MVVVIGRSYDTVISDVAGTGPIQHGDLEDIFAHILLDQLSEGQSWIDRL